MRHAHQHLAFALEGSAAMRRHHVVQHQEVSDLPREADGLGVVAGAQELEIAPVDAPREAEEDVVRSYSLHANAYVTKPVDFERFVSVVQQIDDFFVSVVRLPKGD